MIGHGQESRTAEVSCALVEAQAKTWAKYKLMHSRMERPMDGMLNILIEHGSGPAHHGGWHAQRLR